MRATPWILMLLLFGCGQTKAGMVVGGPDDEEEDTGTAAPPIEVGGSELVGIGAVTTELGEEDLLIISRYGGDGSENQTIIPHSSLSLDPFWIDRYPFPGLEGQDWFVDGLSHEMVSQLDDWLGDYGRRACTVSELLYAAAGRDNQRYPYGDGSFDINACDPDDSNPEPLGTYTTCESPLGIRDFQVRSTWAQLDAQMLDVMMATPQQPGFPGDYTHAVWGGTSRTDTFYSPNNFGFHVHDVLDEAYVDDGFRVCAGPDAPTDEQNTAYAYWLEDVIMAGSYEALFE